MVTIKVYPPAAVAPDGIIHMLGRLRRARSWGEDDPEALIGSRHAVPNALNEALNARFDPGLFSVIFLLAVAHRSV